MFLKGLPAETTAKGRIRGIKESKASGSIIREKSVCVGCLDEKDGKKCFASHDNAVQFHACATW